MHTALGPQRVVRLVEQVTALAPHPITPWSINGNWGHIGPIFQFNIYKDTPHSVFKRPENLFQPPDSLFNHITVRDVIIARDVALQDGSWVFVVGAIGLIAAVIWAARKSSRTLALLSIDEEDDENDRFTLEKRAAINKNAGMKELRKQEIMEMNNRGLYWLLSVTIISVWMAGFLGDFKLFP